MNNEQILKAAFSLADEELSREWLLKAESLPDVFISEADRKRILAALNRSGNTMKKSTKRALKVLLAAAIILLIMTVTVFAYKPSRNFVVTKFYDASEIIFTQTSGKGSLYPEYEYIPEGYIQTKTEKDKSGILSEYKCGSAGLYIISSKSKNSVIFFDSEDGETGETEIGEAIGYYSITDRNVILMWPKGKYCYAIIADRTARINDIDVLVKIAQSQKP